MKLTLLPLPLIALAGCTNGSAPPAPAPPAQTAPQPAPQPLPAVSPDPMTPAQPIPPAAPGPPQIPMPAMRVFLADWTGPSIGLTGFMVRKMPPEFSSGDPKAKWFTNAAPGLGGFACADPAPNAGYHCENGCLVMTPGPLSVSGGFPVISAQTFSKDFHTAINCEIWFDDTGQFGSYGGPVLDNGEDNYFAEYGQNCDHATISLIVDQNLANGAPPMANIAIGVWHTMQIHYFPDGTFRMLYDGVEYVPLGIQNPYPFRNDPHLSIFCGGFGAMKIRKLEVWSDNPNATAV